MDSRRSGLILASLGLAVLVSLTALGTWIQHLQALPVSPVRVEELTPPAVSLPTLAYRVEQLEKQVEKFEDRLGEVRDQHVRMLGLLAANLAGVLGSLVTYLVTQAGRRRNPEGPTA